MSGNDRFDTAGALAGTFAPKPTTIYIANGFHFPDALSGGALAANDGSPILLISHADILLNGSVQVYLQNLRAAVVHPNVVGLGGTFVVPYPLIKQAEAILNGEPITLF